MAEKTGGCLCGAVRFSATDVGTTFGVCHCEMCRRWSGSAFVNVAVPVGNVTWTGEAQIATLQTSDWAERAWCRRCGSHLYWRMTEENDYSDTVDLALGLFDDPSGFEMTSEIWVDEKPDSFSYVDQGHIKMTRAECAAKFPRLDEDK